FRRAPPGKGCTNVRAPGELPGALLRPAQRLVLLRHETGLDRHGSLEYQVARFEPGAAQRQAQHLADRKSTRLNSSHVAMSYAVFCLTTKTTGHCSERYTPSHS